MNDTPDPFSQAGSAESEAALLKDLAALPRAIRPARDPWPEISQRISAATPGQYSHQAAHPGRSRPVGWALAASVLLAVLSALFIMRGPGVPAPGHAPLAAGTGQGGQTSAGPVEFAAPWPDFPAEREYLAAFREFARLDLSQTVVADTTHDAIMQDWAVMRQLEQDLSLALEQEPDNALLQDRWIRLRASQLQLLHVIAEAGQWPGRTLI